MSTDADIEALVRAFETTALPRSDWTHGAHLTVALWYLRTAARDQATHLMREGICRYNQSHGNSSGYHETITLAWIAVVARFIAENDRGQPICSLAARLLETCAHKDHLLRFYSRDVLMSDDARRRWVPPDLRPIEDDASLPDRSALAPNIQGDDSGRPSRGTPDAHIGHADGSQSVFSP